MERKYKANKEWTKDFKFNGYWYRLSSLFDRVDKKNKDFDFNADYDKDFDFNQDIFVPDAKIRKSKNLNEY